MTIDEFAAKLRARTVTAAEVTEACLQRVESDNERLNAFIHVMGEHARMQARQADKEIAAGQDRGPLHGVPISVKDLYDVEDVPTTAASKVREFHIASRDAAVIGHLRQLGAVLIGKTNLHEFAFGTTSEDSAYGPARNPHDPSRSPGGSSGGSAASIVAGMALASLGTDTGGSIRIPAAACGIVGLKPSYGEISVDGVVPLSRTLDHAGPLAQTVSDVWTVFNGLQARQPAPLKPPAAGQLRLAVLRSYFCDLLDDEVRDRFESAIDTLRASGAAIREHDVPHAGAISAIYMQISFGDAAAYHASTLEATPELYTTPVRLRLELARYVTAEDYVRAMAGRDVLKTEVDVALSECDALLLPTLPIPAPVIGENSVQVGSSKEPVRAMMLRLTQLFNLTGHPALSIPCGRTTAGLPVGLQIVGRTMKTEALVNVAASLEKVIRSG